MITEPDDRLDLICDRVYGEFTSEGVAVLIAANPQLTTSLILPRGIPFTVPEFTP